MTQSNPPADRLSLPPSMRPPMRPPLPLPLKDAEHSRDPQSPVPEERFQAFCEGASALLQEQQTLNMQLETALVQHSRVLNGIIKALNDIARALRPFLPPESAPDGDAGQKEESAVAGGHHDAGGSGDG